MVHIHDNPPRSETICVKGAVYTSSFEEECQSLESAAQWITGNCDSSTDHHRQPVTVQGACGTRALSGRP